MRPRFSLRQRSRHVVAATVAATVVASALGGLALAGLLQARGQLIDRIDPSIVEVQRLRAALVDQETGLRAYVLTADPSYLAPYRSGLEDEAASRDRLDAVLPGEATRQATAQLDASIVRWRVDYAEPTLDAVEAGRTEQAAAAIGEGRARFDELRAAGDRLEAQLLEERDDASGRLSAATTRLVAALVIAEVLLLSVTWWSWRLLRRSVQAPLDHLRANAIAVADGELARPIEALGPAELFELGEAMEAMRDRILAELAESTEAGEELRRRQTELARSNAELEQFAYVASHDLQEPLRKVAAFCQLLQSRYGGQLDERADQYIGFAVDGAKRMQALINDLLAFSRVGRVTRPFDTVELDDVLHTARLHLAEAIEEAGATIRATPLPAVLGEQALLVAVFQNLIGNAVKFRRPEAAPVVDIEHRCIDGTHHLTVSDNGIGIDPEYAERVFVIFQRLHPKEDYPGTGIGLALCRKIVEYHGGRITVRVPDGHDGHDGNGTVGTVIDIELPAIPTGTDEDQPGAIDAPEPADGRSAVDGPTAAIATT